MKHLLLIAGLVCCVFAANAQSTQVIYYPNGNKHIEGACDFSFNPYFSSNLLSTLFLGETRRRRRDDETYYIPDADEGGSFSSEDRRTALANLTMICDGPVRMYFPDGSKQVEVTFKHGKPSGPCTVFYPTGKPSVQGTMEAGMPTGVWTRYYKSGRVFSTGRYVPFTQQELRNKWQKSITEKELDDADNAERGLTEEGLRESSYEARALAHVFQQFSRFTGGLLQQGRKEGPFTFLRADGKKWAEINYTAGVRIGTWTIWNSSGKADLSLEYSPSGQVVAITDSAGTRQTLKAFTEAWKAKEAARFRDAPQYGDPNGIDPGTVDPMPPPTTGEKKAEIFSIVDQMPEFAGDINGYIRQNTRYPSKAKAEGIEGRVIVQFVVQEDGRITYEKVLRGIGGGCDEEALRIVRGMPRWKPGKQNGKPVPVFFNLPIQFKLQ